MTENTMDEAVGIMGGTFDPVHFGHLVAAEEARLRFGLARVVFVPNGRPPHKKGYRVTAAERRYEMAFLATAGNPGFETSRIELDREGPSYAVDTVAAFRRRFGARARLYFITGADAMLEYMTWREPHRLAGMCEFIAAMRPGYDARHLADALGEDLMERCRVLRIPGVDISSTELRRRAASGESLRYFTPPAVSKYITQHRLYADPDARGSAAG